MNISFPSKPDRIPTQARVYPTLVTGRNGEVSISGDWLQYERPTKTLQPLENNQDIYAQKGNITGGGKAVTVLGFYGQDAALNKNPKDEISRMSSDWKQRNIRSENSDFRFTTLANAQITKNGVRMNDTDRFVIVEFPKVDK